MTSEHQLAVVEERGLAPAAVVGQATERATVLMKIVEERHLYTKIGDKKYLEAEAWQTILAFDEACPVTEWVHPILGEAGERIGYEAKVNITKDGAVVAAGIMSCGFEEFPCRGRQGMAKDRAAMSAAQTWAGAKAARMRYAWVAVLAGYEPTPAAEMQEDAGTGQSKEHWCSTHKTVWFKRGTMKGYAHPIGEKIEGQKQEWCNEAEAEASESQQAEFTGADFANWCKSHEIDKATAAKILGAPDLNTAMKTRTYAQMRDEIQKHLDEPVQLP